MKSGSTLQLFAVTTPDGNTQPVAEGVVHIFAPGRRAVSFLLRAFPLAVLAAVFRPGNGL